MSATSSIRDPLGRRDFLQAAGGVGLALAMSRSAAGQPEAGGWAHLTTYLESLARPDGGYGWPDQLRSHLTPTYAVIGCYAALGAKPPNAPGLADFVRTNHPSRLKKLEQERRGFTHQQVQSLVWLGADASALHDVVRAWRRPLAYLKQYERHGYPVFQQELGAITSRKLLGLPLDDLAPEYLDYVLARRRPDGSFNNTPAADGSGGHVTNTWWGLRALEAWGRAAESRTETIAWLRSCQLAGGGFTYAPQVDVAGWDDAAYTWAALRSLALLGAEPSDRRACIAYLRSLATEDGGFSDRPGWASNPLATFYVLDSLAALKALDAVATPRPRTAARVPPALPGDLKVFSIQLEAHGKGSPADAVELARSLKIDLWGAKNARPEWLARAQSLADEQRVPVRFFVANEEYGTWVSLPGMGTYSHTSDILAPAAASIGPSLAGEGVVTWDEYRRRRLDPLHKGKGRLVWQFGENEELVRILLDDSLRRGGFAAISTFHFGNPDFTNTEPFLKRYRLQLPFVALQDAHGNEPWWFADMTAGFRTLFLAREPTWDGWLSALKNNWVVAVRHDAASSGQTWMHGGPPAVLDFVRQHASQWQWWDNPDIGRPLVSLVALSPGALDEAGRPEKGVALRVRCAWENTSQGLAKKPIAELVQLTVDGQKVEPELVVRRRPNGLFEDYYHLHSWPQAPEGKHTATATVRHLATSAETQRTIEFVV